jgi:hypothetical protein
VAHCVIASRQRARPLNSVVKLQARSPKVFAFMRRIVRRVLATYAVTFVAAVGFVVLAINVSQAFVAGAMFTAMFGAAALVLIACPKCGRSVLLQDQKVFGIAVNPVFVPFSVPKVCRACGHEL